MRAIILAGGKGTRLKPYTTSFPKPLMPVGGYPILEILIRQLVRHGCDHVTVTVGHMARLIEVYFGDGSQFGLKIDYSHEDKPLGTMGPLRRVHNLPENFLVMNGDILSDFPFSQFFAEHVKSRNIFTIGSYKREINSDFGVLEVSDDGWLTGFKEKPRLPFLVSMGIYAVNRAAVEFIPPDQPFGFDQLMLAFLAKRRPARIYRHEGFWLDIGRPEDYEQAQEAFEGLRDRLLGEISE